jgi:hypothetical protein
MCRIFLLNDGVLFIFQEMGLKNLWIVGCDVGHRDRAELRV